MAITLQTAQKEYEKNPDIKKEDIAKLMDWVDKQPHLPKLTEVHLIFFYHSCLYSMELTKTTIDLNLTLRTHVDFFKDRDPLTSKAVTNFDICLFAMLPQQTQLGYKVIYCRLMDTDPTNFSFESCVNNLVLVNDLSQLEEGTFDGYIIILDLECVTFGHLSKLHILAIKSTLFYLQEAMPVRLKGFHFMNTPSFMDKILALMRPFMKKNFTDMLYLHPDPKTIFDMVPQEIFPKELGGKSASFAELQVMTKERVQNNRQLIMADLKVDESRRPGKPKDFGQIFGVDGSFKRLDID